MVFLGLITPVKILIIASALLLGLLLPIIALLSILKSEFKDNDKLIWAIVVLFLPVVGSVLYFTKGKNSKLK